LWASDGISEARGISGEAVREANHADEAARKRRGMARSLQLHSETG